jgi:hypothetical protein
MRLEWFCFIALLCALVAAGIALIVAVWLEGK